MQTSLPGIISIANSDEKNLLCGVLLGQIRVKILQTNLLQPLRFFRIGSSG